MKGKKKKSVCRVFSLFLLFTLLTSCEYVNKPAPIKEVKQPNILFIITDDHAYQAISAYDDRLIHTPNIDRLAEEGMLFDRAYVTNSICSPSRAVALTGKFSHLNSVRDNLDVFDTAQMTFPRILQQFGYETAIFGKWHLKSEPVGFDHWKVLPDQGHYYHPEFKTDTGEIKINGYVTDVVTDLALEYLGQKRDTSKPFMLMYNHKAPHRQWWPSMEDIEALGTRQYPLPNTLFDDYKNRGRAASEAEMQLGKHMGLTLDNKIRPQLLEELEMTEFLGWYQEQYIERFDRLSEEEQKKWTAVYGPVNEDFYNNTPKGRDLVLWKYQRYLEDYLGTIKSVDRNIGRVLDYLDENGLSENTLVIYTSDQGFYLGEHGWFDKRFMYEESFRTPLIIRYPNLITANTTNSGLVQNIDFAPTILNVVGAEVPQDMQGISLLPLFDGNNDDWRESLYYHYYEYPGIHMVKRHYGIRTNRYKLIHFYYDIDEWELYDLETDPEEMKNVYDHPDYTEIRNQLHQSLDELRIRYKDSKELDREFIVSDSLRLIAIKELEDDEPE